MGNHEEQNLAMDIALAVNTLVCRPVLSVFCPAPKYDLIPGNR